MKGFVIKNALSTGGYANRPFLAITNYRTKSITELQTYIQIWDQDQSKFDLRQKIPTTGAMSVDVLEHGNNVYISITNTGPESYLTIYRWVPGSFRDKVISTDYGWPEGQMFRWMPGLFYEPIQTIPTHNAMGAVLLHLHGEAAMFLAVSNVQNENSNKVNISIYPLRETVCEETPVSSALNISCFDSVLSILALGAQTVKPFAVNGSNYLAIASHFNGDATSK